MYSTSLQLERCVGWLADHEDKRNQAVYSRKKRKINKSEAVVMIPRIGYAGDGCRAGWLVGEESEKSKGKKLENKKE